MLNEYTQFYTVSVRTFVIPFYYDSGSGSGSGTVINHDTGSGSDFSARYGSDSGSARQKVTVPTVPVPQCCILGHFSFYRSTFCFKVCKKC